MIKKSSLKKFKPIERIEGENIEYYVSINFFDLLKVPLLLVIRSAPYNEIISIFSREFRPQIDW
jgi:hypothetical protein